MFQYLTSTFNAENQTRLLFWLKNNIQNTYDIRPLLCHDHYPAT